MDSDSRTVGERCAEQFNAWVNLAAYPEPMTPDRQEKLAALIDAEVARRDAETIRRGQFNAAWCTASPHEWKWSDKEALEMARTICLMQNQQAERAEQARACVSYLCRFVDDDALSDEITTYARARLPWAFDTDQKPGTPTG